MILKHAIVVASQWRCSHVRVRIGILHLNLKASSSLDRNYVGNLLLLTSPLSWTSPQTQWPNSWHASGQQQMQEPTLNQTLGRNLRLGREETASLQNRFAFLHLCLHLTSFSRPCFLTGSAKLEKCLQSISVWGREKHSDHCSSLNDCPWRCWFPCRVTSIFFVPVSSTGKPLWLHEANISTILWT